MNMIIDIFRADPVLSISGGLLLALGLVSLYIVLAVIVGGRSCKTTPVHRKPAQKTISPRKQRRLSRDRATRNALLVVHGGGFHAPNPRRSP